MRHINKSNSLLIAVLIAAPFLANGQDAQTPRPKGVVWDWTHHHLIYSNPKAADPAVREKILNDPRYIMQQQKRGVAVDAGADRAAAAAESAPASSSASKQPDASHKMSAMKQGTPAGPRMLPAGMVKAIIPPPGGASEPIPAAADSKHHRIKKDWSETLGATSGTAGASAGTTGLGEFPATFSTGGTSCTDFAVFNTGLASSSSQADIVAYDNLYSTCNSGVPTVYWAYNNGSLGGPSSTITNSPVLSADGTQVAFVQTVPPGTAAFGSITASTAIPTAGQTITVGSVTYTWETTTSITTVNQMSTHGMEYTYDIVQTVYAALTGSRANCPTTNTTCISTSQTANSAVTATYGGVPSTVVNLAASCGVGTCGNGIALSDSGSTAEVVLSPATGGLSGGSGTPGVGGAQLVVMQWAPGGTLTSPTTLASNSSYPNCTAPCMIALPFSGTPTDTYSSPFIAYGPPGTIYVGDDNGNLHQFQNVFLPNTGTSASPSEVIGNGWPVAVSVNGSLGSPVWDSVSGNVFVGDYTTYYSTETCQVYAGTNPCGYLYSISPAGAVTQSAQLDYNVGILDSPIVDSTIGSVYVFVGDDGSTNCNYGACAGVYQFSTTFLGGTSGTEARAGSGYEFMMSGAFDNNYFTSPNATGNLYVVGNTGAANNTLYQLPVNAGVISTTTNAGPAVGVNYTSGYYSAGLQVSEFYNTSGANNHDYLFLSVLGFGANTTNIPCPSQSASIGCIMGFDVTSGAVSSSTASTGVLSEVGGTSGIVVDNGASGASNIYFSTLLNQACTTSGGTNGCAIQTTQAAP